MSIFKRPNPNSQLSDPELTYTSVERRVQQVEELHGWIPGQKQSVMLSILLELILERNVIPKFNKQLEQIDRILALALFTTYRILRGSLKQDEHLDKDFKTAARVVVKTSSLPTVSSSTISQWREESILSQLKLDSEYRSLLTRLCNPIARQKLGAGRAGVELSDIEKFRLLAKALAEVARPYVWRENVE